MGTLTWYLFRRVGTRCVFMLLLFMGLIEAGQFAALVGRGIPPEATLPMLEAIILLAATIAVPLGMTCAILVVVGAMVRDGEIRALTACGIAPYQIAVRLAPLLIIGVLITGVLAHEVVPRAMSVYHQHRGRMYQAAIAKQVASGDSIEVNGLRLWARAAEGRRLDDLFLTSRDGGTLTATHARSATWDITPAGLMLYLRDVNVVRREADGQLTSVWLGEAPPIPFGERGGPRNERSEPESMSTPQLYAVLRDFDPQRDRREDYNNASLAFNLRIFLPMALVLFGIFAAGIALVIGAGENLIAFAVMVLVVCLSTVPAIEYVKKQETRELISPAWLLWSPALTFAGAGVLMIARPDHVRRWFAARRWGRRKRPA